MQEEIVKSQTMDIVTQERTKELKPYKFNEELFDLLKGSDYKALKEDIIKNGVKVELHILPDKTVICGHQRLRIAKDKDLKIEHLRCKTVYGLDTPEMVREYVILDNLLRRQLTPEKQAFLLDDLSKQYETGRGGDHKSKDFKKDNMSSLKQPLSPEKRALLIDKLSKQETEDVNKKTAKKVNVSAKTVQRARAYVKAVKKHPKKYKNKKITYVLKAEKEERDKQKIEEIAPQLKVDGIFKTIVIDPPWKHYGSAWGYQEREKAEYATMTTDKIKEYIDEKIIDHIDDNAHIYLWVINNRIHEALHLLEEWGFDFKTIITWCKPQMGMGKYFRNNTEQLLFAVKGKLDLKKHDIPTWFKADRGKHSVKPDESYEFIEKASHPPYLDVFARKKRKGWSCMGDINED